MPVTYQQVADGSSAGRSFADPTGSLKKSQATEGKCPDAMVKAALALKK